MQYNTTTSPDFAALKLALTNGVFKGYTAPIKKEERSMHNSKAAMCPSGKESFLSLADVMKAKKTRGSYFRDKSFYRCSICGHYHFSQKVEAPATRFGYHGRNRVNESLKHMVTLYSADRAELEYASLP